MAKNSDEFQVHRARNGTLEAIVFYQKAHNHAAGHFTIPKPVMDQFGWLFDPLVYLEVSNVHTGQQWRGRHQVKSGSEVYGHEFDAIVPAGAELRVLVARPGFAGTVTAFGAPDPIWQKLAKSAAKSTPIEYSQRMDAQSGTVVVHQKFGLGFVESVQGSNAKIRFADGPKTLRIHAS